MALLEQARGSAFTAPDEVTHAAGLETNRFGGSLWYELVRMGVDTLAAGAWAPGQTAGVGQTLPIQYDPWAVARLMTPAQIAQILSEIRIASPVDLGAGTTATGEVGGSPGAGTPGPSGE
jgi:hypothetical protein